MRGSRTRFIVVGALAFASATVTWVFIDSRPAVTFAVAGFTTNHYQEVCAVVAITNNSSRSLMYSGWPVRHFPDYSVLYEDPLEWKETIPFPSPHAGRMHTLSPGDGFTFEAVVEPGRRCLVAIYLVKMPSRLWQRLPSWLAQRRPGASPKRIMTDTICLERN